jgi:hypothetical protein
MGSPAGVASRDVRLLEVGEAGAESMNLIRHRSETETRQVFDKLSFYVIITVRQFYICKFVDIMFVHLIPIYIVGVISAQRQSYSDISTLCSDVQ